MNFGEQHPDALGTRHSAAKPRLPARGSGAVTVETYRLDPVYPRIVRVVESILERGEVVAPVDVLVGMGLLDPKHL